MRHLVVHGILCTLVILLFPVRAIITPGTTLETFRAGVCRRGEDDAILFQTSYVDCVSECRARPRCGSINVYQRSNLCVLNFDHSLATQECKFYIHSLKSDWTQKTSLGCESTDCLEHQRCEVLSSGRPSCVNSECRRISAVENGVVHGNEVRPGKRMAISCYDGYHMEGGSTTTCQSDLRWTDENPRCSDIDECTNSSLNHCQANAVCSNTEGSYMCGCGDGFTANGTVCTDIDECTDPNLNNCHDRATCRNTDGNYTCTCDDGFTGNGSHCSECTFVGNGDVCTDIDECSNPTLNNCHDRATCRNSDGNYTCTCEDGFTGNGSHCSDIDECSNPTLNNCHDRATCRNTDGNYTCTCEDGFTGNGSHCSDIDECSNPTLNYCHDRATCRNLDGNYTCTCEDGYTGNGSHCSDIDECTDSGLNHCQANAVCNNTEGSYMCACGGGFTGIGTVCTDINECETTAACGDLYTTCVNTVGSFKCECVGDSVWNGLSCILPLAYNQGCDSENPCQVGFECNGDLCKCPFGRVYNQTAGQCHTSCYEYGTTFQRHYRVKINMDSALLLTADLEETECKVRCRVLDGCNSIWMLTSSNECSYYNASLENVSPIADAESVMLFRDCSYRET